jgi:tRNA-Thr(GGU) m(6)t(6)A37 methyltransferase TsaA
MTKADSKDGVVTFIGQVLKVEGEKSTIEIFSDYCPGLMGLEEYSHLWVLYWFHQRDTSEHRKVLKVKPRRHGKKEYTGVYSTRSPSRPNPIGQTLVKLTNIEGCILNVDGLDALEGSPVIDLKPYNPRSESIKEAKGPEWSYRSILT